MRKLRKREVSGPGLHSKGWITDVSPGSLTLESVGFFCVGVIVVLFSFFYCCTCGIREVPRQGVESELQLQAYATATATPNLSCFCCLHRSLQQCQILNPRSQAKDGNCIPTETMS